MTKRIIAIILTIILCLGLIPAQVFAADSGSPEVTAEVLNTTTSDEIITRAQWISELVKLFEMSVESNQYPDNYFSDLTSDSEYYYDMLLAVEFGVLNVEAGSAVYPEEPATRDFAASTLNFCLGFQPEKDAEYTYSDVSAVSDADAVQVAVNRGWFALVGGAFRPELPITAAEQAVMLEDAAKVRAEDQVDKDYTSSVSLAEGVIEVPAGTAFDLVSENVITLADCAVEIQPGDIFVVYNEKLPMVYKAVEVETEDSVTTISFTTEGTEDALLDYDFEGVVQADLEDFQGTDATSYNVGGTTVYLSKTARSIGYDKGSKTLTASKTVSLGTGVDATISVRMTNLNFELTAKKIKCDYRVVMTSDTTLTANVSVDMLEALGAAKTISLGYVPVAGIGYVELAVEFSLSGEVSLVWVGNVQAGFAYNRSEGFRLIRSFNKHDFYFTAEVTMRTGLVASAGIKTFVFDASVWARIGAHMNVNATIHDSGSPRKCLDMYGYMYASVGAGGSILGIFDFGTSVDIYTASNSPIRAYYHYEDGQWTGGCSRGCGGNYYTDPGSSYFNPGVSNGSSKYTSSSGELITVYYYALDEDERATITGYNGVGSALYIPSTIDGFTVVSIGKEAFRNRTSLRSVRIPNTVQSIDERAFQGCTNLSVVLMPNSLVSLGYEAFADCHSLTSINIPDSVTHISSGAFADCMSLMDVELPAALVDLGACAFRNCAIRSIRIPKGITNGGGYINYSGWNQHGAFEDCAKLKTVIFEEGIAMIPNHLFSFCTGIEEIVIPDTVTEIEEYAFHCATNLKTVTFGNSIETIYSNAFRSCTNLLAAAIPDSVIIIENGAFAECESLATVTLSKSLERLDACAFLNCIALTQIEIPKSLTSGGGYVNYGGWNQHGAFEGCDNLKTVVFEEEITMIPNHLFSFCTGIEEIVIPDTVTEIEEYAFHCATNLKTVTFGNSIETIYSNAFRGCTDLLAAEIPDSVIIIENGAFAECNELATVTLSKSLERLDACAFLNCIALTQIEIPKSLTSGGGYVNYGGWNQHGAFEGCDNLKTVTFEEGITMIPNHLFSYCTGIEEIVVPDTVTVIEEYAFHCATILKTVTFSQNLETIYSNAFRGCTDLLAAEIPDSVIIIENGAFAECNELATVTLSKSLERLDACAFLNCIALTEIEIPKSLTSGGSYINYGGWDQHGAFEGCDNLKTVTFEEGITMIPNHLFSYCTGIEEITIPSTVESFEDYAFFHCTALKNIVIPDTVTFIGAEMFQNCTALESISWTSSVTAIPNHTFKNCTALSEVKLPDNLLTINSYAFENCDSLVNFILPDSVSTINEGAFFDCDGLVNIELPDNLKQLPYRAFYDCDALASIDIPYGVTSVGSHAFYDCDLLETVTMTNSVTSIGRFLFHGCDVLKNVSLSRNLTSIPDHVFYSCPMLEQIVIPYNATSIGENAFNSNPKLVKVVTYANLSSIHSTAFSYPTINVFYGMADSYAQTWAKENGYKFVVNAVAATGVSIDKTALTLPKGTTANLILTVTPEDASDSVTFLSSKESVATVDASGKITAVGVGTATIKVYVGNYSASCKVTVTQAVTKITLNKRNLSLNVPETYQLTATVSPSDASNQTLTWTSSNEAAATVDENGKITAVGNGTATITATANDGTGISVSCTVTVIDPNNIPVSSITLNSYNLNLEARETFQLTAAVKPDTAANKNIIWTSSDESIVTVDENGMITTIAKGTATVTATAADGNGATAVCNVTVTNTGYEVTDLNAFESGHPYAPNCNDFWFYTHETPAESLSITFDPQTAVEEDFDYILIFDGEGLQIGAYTGTQLAGQTVEVQGGKVKVQLQTNSLDNQWGFKVTHVEAVTHIHSYEPVVTDPNCTEQGYTTYTCSGCGHTYLDAYTDPLGHDYRMISDSATCSQDGVKTYLCSVCDDTYTEESKATGVHTYSKKVTAPTCTAQGYTTYTCDCGESYVSEYTPTVDHAHQLVSDTATCGEDGLKTYRCVFCGDTYTEYSKATGQHSYSEKVTAPTCTAKGYTTHTCHCGDSYVDSHTNALGHNYRKGTCTRCGSKTTYVAAPVVKASNVAKTGKIQVRWNKVSGAAKYQVYCSTSKNSGYKLLITTSQTSMVNSKAVAGKTYYYYVIAVAKDGTESVKSNKISCTCDLAQPKVTLSNVASSGKIRVSWNKVGGAVKYEVYRATSQNGKYIRLITTRDTSIVDSKAIAGKTYYYKIKAIAVNSSANSAYSEVKSIICDLAQPDVTVARNKKGKPVVSWDKVSGARSYKVTIYNANGKQIKTMTTTKLSITHTAAVKNKTYSYRVMAIHANSGANSAISSAVRIKSR